MQKEPGLDTGNHWDWSQQQHWAAEPGQGMDLSELLI